MPETTLTIKAKNLTKQAFNAIQKSLDKTTGHFEKLAKESQQTSKGIIGSLNRLKSALQANQEGFQAVAIGAGVVAASTGLLTKSFISAAMQMEKMKMGLTAVMGSTKAMEKHFKDLEKVARLPGLGLPEAVQGSQRLQAVGVSAKEAARQLEAFGLGVARVGGGREELMRVVEQFSQMSAKGKILMDDLRPIRAIMPDINKAMQTAFGTRNIEQIRDMGIEAEEFISKVTTELLKLPRVGNTAANSIENLTDTVFKLKAQLGEILLPTVSKIIDAMSKLVTWLTNLSKTQKSIIAWGTAITAAVATAAAALAGLGLALPTIISGLALLSGPVGIGVLAIGTITALAAAFLLLKDNTTKASDEIDKFGKTVLKVDELSKKAHIGLLSTELFRVQELLRKMDEGMRAAGITLEDQFTSKSNIKRYKELQDRIKNLKAEIDKLYEVPAVPKPTAGKMPVSIEAVRKIKPAQRIPLRSMISLEHQAAKTLGDIRKQELDDEENFYEKQTQLRIEAIERDAKIRLQAIEGEEKEYDFRVRLAEGIARVEEKTNAEMAKSATNYLKNQEQVEESIVKIKELTVQRKQNIEKAYYDWRVRKILEVNRAAVDAGEDEVQAMTRWAKEQKIVNKQLIASVVQTITSIPADIANVFRERRRIEHDAQEDILQINRDTQDRIKEIQSNTTLSHIEKLRQIEQAERQSADRRKRIEEDLNKAKSQAFKGYVQSFLSGIARMIQAEAQRRLVSGISSMFAGGTFAAGAAMGPAGIAAMLAIGFGGQMLGGSFDNPIHDAMARGAGRHIAMTYGTSFDNPTNDMRAKLRGTMSASQSLGERSAGDMLSHFSKGFETQANAVKAGQSQGNDGLQGILGKIEQRLSETPQFTFMIDGRELHAQVRRVDDRTEFRRSVY